MLLVATQVAGADRWAAGSVLPLFVITIAAAEIGRRLAIVLRPSACTARIDLDEPSGEAPVSPWLTRRSSPALARRCVGLAVRS